ncbi:OmpA family protein [Litorimonas taeanensis]|uniref:OmpA family protein n=1 Tax=Litorimonas taeanensis TaxID=568099 RepID=A0A420WLC9_9PROT|nr:OmpA family protein [Litorimonas taeanensis]RKQ71685.1 OmpA family protein [Litorimonas taeanensis]
MKNLAILLSTLSATAMIAAAPSAAAQDMSICSQSNITQLVYYEFGKAQSAETMSQIESIQNISALCDVRSIELIGHTDTVGSTSTNQALSVRRANNVKNALVKMGLPASGITTSGRGESEPFIPTADGVQEQLNRRVEVRMTLNPLVVEEPTYVEPEPVFVEPEPVYVEPEPVFVEPEPVVEASPVVEPAPVASQTPPPPPQPVATGPAIGNSALILAGAAAAAAGLYLILDDDDEPSSP